MYYAEQLFHSSCKQVSSPLSCCYKITRRLPVRLQSFNKLASVTAAHHFITSVVRADKIKKSSDGDYKPLIALSELQQHIVLKVHTLNKSWKSKSL